MSYYILYLLLTVYFSYFTQDVDIESIAEGINSAQPKIVTISTRQQPRQVYIVAEQLHVVIAKISAHNSPS